MGIREDVYDNEIAPLMSKVIDLCKTHGIPMLATFQYTEPGDEPGFCTTQIPAEHEDKALVQIKARWGAARSAPLVALTITTAGRGEQR